MISGVRNGVCVMGEYGEPSFWGEEFHTLPFVSIFGASTAGAVTATMSMAGDGVPVGYAACFLAVWALVTASLLVAANRFFDRPDIEYAAMGSLSRRAGSGAICTVAALAAVFATYKTVDALAATHQAGAATQQHLARVPAKPRAARSVPKESVHFRRTDLLPGQVARLPENLPKPIAPPAEELVSLPKPILTVASSGAESKILKDGDSISLGEPAVAKAKAKARKTVKKRKKKRRVAKIRKKHRVAKHKRSNPLVRDNTKQKSLSSSTIRSASAPAPKRKIRGLTTESGGDTSGKSASCASGHRSLANSACRELGAFSR